MSKDTLTIPMRCDIFGNFEILEREHCFKGVSEFYDVKHDQNYEIVVSRRKLSVNSYQYRIDDSVLELYPVKVKTKRGHFVEVPFGSIYIDEAIEKFSEKGWITLFEV